MALYDILRRYLPKRQARRISRAARSNTEDRREAKRLEKRHNLIDLVRDFPHYVGEDASEDELQFLSRARSGGETLLSQAMSAVPPEYQKQQGEMEALAENIMERLRRSGYQGPISYDKKLGYMRLPKEDLDIALSDPRDVNVIQRFTDAQNEAYVARAEMLHKQDMQADKNQELVTALTGGQAPQQPASFREKWAKALGDRAMNPTPGMQIRDRKMAQQREEWRSRGDFVEPNEADLRLAQRLGRKDLHRFDPNVYVKKTLGGQATDREREALSSQGGVVNMPGMVVKGRRNKVPRTESFREVAESLRKKARPAGEGALSSSRLPAGIQTIIGDVSWDPEELSFKERMHLRRLMGGGGSVR